MPRARNRAPTPEEKVVEEESQDLDQDGGRPLEFDEPITWRPGKIIPVADLLRRLKALSQELASCDQEDAHRETLVPRAQELASQQLLGHKDKGVRTYAMLCIVELFRLLAPDAPYKGGQLKGIFTFFTSTIIPALASPSDPYNQQHNSILQSLTAFKSIVLLTDIPSSDNLVLNLFTNCFDVTSGGVRGSPGEKLPKNLEYHMTSILCTLVDECAPLPSGVVDTILAQFLRADPNALSAANEKGDSRPVQELLEVSPAYNMARAICNTCADKMRQSIGQYFSSVLIDASEIVEISKASKLRGKKRTHYESEHESDDGFTFAPGENDLREVEKAHRLLRELWRSCPEAITNVVPQIESELEAENVQLRTMAVQAVGDMMAGIGAAGPLPTVPLDPEAYPSQSLVEYTSPTQPRNVLLEPNAPHAFSSVYPNAYQRFVDRHRDKAAQIRSAWATEVGRIISTSGGGKGLDEDQETAMVTYLSDLLLDTDEKVRLAAVQAISHFGFVGITQKLAKKGGVADPGTILCHLADRIKDKKHNVRIAAMELLGRIWGVAEGSIAEGSERIRELLGAIPSKIFEAMYVNDREINALMQRVLFEYLLPVAYPPIKSRQASNSDSQRVNDSQATGNKTSDADAIRAERILVLIRDLDDKAKRVFFSLQTRQVVNAKYVEAYLRACEDSSGSSTSDNEKETKKKLDKLIGVLATNFSPEPSIASEHLKKFANHHDRRSYQLIRFCYAPESDYRKIFKAIKELKKRMEEAPASSGMSGVLETLLALIRSAAILVHNRSHVPAIVEISRTDEKGLGTAAHEVLKEISNTAPDIFKVHVSELCETLKKQTPAARTADDSTVIDTLKACAGFARRFPDDMPKDREFYKAMMSYTSQGSLPKAAKYAATVIVSSADKKEMYIKEIQKDCIKGFVYGEEGFLSKLASISQLRVVANKECEDLTDAITDIAINEVLGNVRTVADPSDPEWSEEIDEDLSAKLFALRILVNGLRGFKPSENLETARNEIDELSQPVYKLLNTLIKNDGELTTSESTPKHHKARLRLGAAVQLLKLSCNRQLESQLTQPDFNQLSKIVQDPLPEVRAGFAKALKKYLGSGALNTRFYALVFLYAFEPAKDTKAATITWLKSRAANSAKLNDSAMTGAFVRFLSLLAHHQDFSDVPDELADFVEYIAFFLRNAATQANAPILYHLAQRIKAVQDGIDPEKSENLYILSDIAEAVIRQFQEIQGWPLQLYSGKVSLPSKLFARLPDHVVAQEIADRNYMPEDLADKLEDLVKNSMKTKKRRADRSSGPAAKRPKPSASAHGTVKKLPIRKPPKPAKANKKKDGDEIPSSERRKSTRTSGVRTYAENDDSEDDNELKQWQQDEDKDSDKENVESSTPATSDPTPAPVLEETVEPKKDRVAKRPPRAPVAKKTPQKDTRRQVPARATRVTRGQKERDVMDVPSDSDEEMADAEA